MAKPEGLESLTGGSYVALVVMVTVGIVASALLIAWLLERRGVVAPGSSPVPTGLADPLLEEDGGTDAAGL